MGGEEGVREIERRTGDEHELDLREDVLAQHSLLSGEMKQGLAETVFGESPLLVALDDVLQEDLAEGTEFLSRLLELPEVLVLDRQPSQIRTERNGSYPYHLPTS